MTKSRQIRFTIIRSLVAICIALLVATLLIFISAGGDSFQEKLQATGEALKQMLIGPLFRMSKKKGTSFELKRLADILAAMIPTIFTGLSVCVMFSANQFNLGAEGGIMLGAFASAMAAIYLPLPAGLHRDGRRSRSGNLRNILSRPTEADAAAPQQKRQAMWCHLPAWLPGAAFPLFCRCLHPESVLPAMIRREQGCSPVSHIILHRLGSRPKACHVIIHPGHSADPTGRTFRSGSSSRSFAGILFRLHLLLPHFRSVPERTGLPLRFLLRSER